MPKFNDFFVCVIEPLLDLNIVFLTFSYEDFTSDLPNPQPVMAGARTWHPIIPVGA